MDDAPIIGVAYFGDDELHGILREKGAQIAHLRLDDAFFKIVKFLRERKRKAKHENLPDLFRPYDDDEAWREFHRRESELKIAFDLSACEEVHTLLISAEAKPLEPENLLELQWPENLKHARFATPGDAFYLRNVPLPPDVTRENDVRIHPLRLPRGRDADMRDARGVDTVLAEVGLRPKGSKSHVDLRRYTGARHVGFISRASHLKGDMYQPYIHNRENAATPLAIEERCWLRLPNTGALETVTLLTHPDEVFHVVEVQLRDKMFTSGVATLGPRHCGPPSFGSAFELVLGTGMAYMHLLANNAEAEIAEKANAYHSFDTTNFRVLTYSPDAYGESNHVTFVLPGAPFEAVIADDVSPVIGGSTLISPCLRWLSASVSLHCENHPPILKLPKLEHLLLHVLVYYDDRTYMKKIDVARKILEGVFKEPRSELGALRSVSVTGIEKYISRKEDVDKICKHIPPHVTRIAIDVYPSVCELDRALLDPRVHLNPVPGPAPRPMQSRIGIMGGDHGEEEDPDTPEIRAASLRTAFHAEVMAHYRAK